MTERPRLVVLAPPELRSGFRLAGVSAVVVETPAQVEDVLDEVLAENPTGVIAVYRPYYEAMSEERRHRLETWLQPVVVPLPSGLGAAGGEERHARLMDRLRRAIGYHITFGEDGRSTFGEDGRSTFGGDGR